LDHTDDRTDYSQGQYPSHLGNGQGSSMYSGNFGQASIH